MCHAQTLLLIKAHVSEHRAPGFMFYRVFCATSQITRDDKERCEGISDGCLQLPSHEEDSENKPSDHLTEDHDSDDQAGGC